MLDSFRDELGDLLSDKSVNLVVDLISWGLGEDGGLLVEELVLDTNVAGTVAVTVSSSSAALSEGSVSVLLEILSTRTINVEVICGV